MPLTFANPQQEYIIKKIGGSARTRRHLEDLGLCTGSAVKVISGSGENVIVHVKDSRLALSGEMARRIIV